MAKLFFTNRNGNTLMKEFTGILTHNPTLEQFDAVVGFLRASGYFALRPLLDNINKARILIGIDVDKYIVRANKSGKLFFGAEEEVKEDYLQMLLKDIEKSHYSIEVENGIKQMVQDIIDGKLELRAHPSKKIHAKIYLFYPKEFNSYTSGILITGSSNLSGNGLGISSEKQYEFNVKIQDYQDVKEALDEFELLWKESKDCPIEAIDIDTTIKKTYIGGDVSAHDLYLKMLMEYFADRPLETDASNVFDMPEGYTRYEYQSDAVLEGYQKLIKYDGFFLADVVGLGKTVIASMIAKKFCIENGYENTRILVVYPPAVEQNWKSTFQDFGIDHVTKFITNGSLSKVLDEENYDYWDAEEYDLILVDEAHNFRNHTSGAFEQLQEICKMPRINSGGVPGIKKKVMLISATPLNNSPLDLYNQILLFQDPRRCTIDGISNLTSFFSPLVQEFKKLRREPEYDLQAYKKLAEKVRSRVMKPLTVRRTRTDIESIPRYNKDINGFPKVAAPHKNTYELNDSLADLFEKSMNILKDNISYARYKAISYLLPEKAKDLYENVDIISRNLASISKNSLVKRLESSFYAFKKSLARFTQANQNMIDMLENNCVFIAPDLDINKMYALGMTDEEIEEKLNEKAEKNPKNAKFEAKDFDPEYITALKADQELLNFLNTEWASVTDDDDSKYDKFEYLLKHELFKKSINQGQKLVIFSESLDTVNYLAQRINRKDVLVISAANRNANFKTIRANFDANVKESDRKNDYNIIITTDVLAEGVNLHRSNIIVNYDTPWNSTRLMQRIGRVNRIGSVSKNIYNYVFYPSRQGNKEINLNRVVLSKIQTFHSVLGEDNQIYSTEEIIDFNLDRLFSDAIKEEQKERDKELPYYEELRNLYLCDRKNYNRIKKLSMRSRTGRKSRTVEGVTLSGDTIVFLKTNYRKVFFLSNDTVTEEIPPIDAFSYFKADAEEKSVPRIPNHHKHVQCAVDKLNNIISKEIAQEDLSNGSQAQNLGVQVATATSLINAFLPEIQDSMQYQQMVELRQIAEQGVITKVAKRLQRIQKDLGKAKIDRNEALAEIIEMAKHYHSYYIANEELAQETEQEAGIILSESFE